MQDWSTVSHVQHIRTHSQPTPHYITTSRLARDQMASTWSSAATATNERPQTASSRSQGRDSLHISVMPPKKSLVRVRVRELLHVLLGRERGNKAQRAKAVVGVVRQASLKRKNTTNNRKAHPDSPTIHACVADQMHGSYDKASQIAALNTTRGLSASGPRICTPQHRSRKSDLPSFLPIS